MIDFLEKYEFITSWILLPVEITFLCLMLWEFKYIRREQKEKRMEESEKKVQLLNICIVDIIIVFFHKHKDNNQLVKKFLDKDKDLITYLCANIHKDTHVSVEYIEFYIKYLIFYIKSDLKETGKENEPINSKEICSYCKRAHDDLSNGFYEYNNALKSRIVCNIYDFFTDKQIDEIYDYKMKKFEKFYKDKL